MISKAEKRWLLPVLVILAGMCVYFICSRLGSPPDALAQLRTGEENGILVVPIQTERDRYGLAIVDTIGETLWIYEISTRGPAHNRLKLLAARSWQYDKLLQQYNTAEPKPEQVKLLLEKLSQPQKKQTKERQQNSEVNILEKVIPDDKDSSG
ncbi:MAG: hypothetical protein ACYS8Y_04000 [Planctomycetota bacterium]|jgi:hypothetical protein